MSTAGPAPKAFDAALREAVDRRGLSLERISAHLRARGHMISIATLSYWQSGHSFPSRPASLRAVGALEAVLRTPRGSLAGLVPAPAVEPPLGVEMADDTGRRLERFAEASGFDWVEDFLCLCVHASFFVDERGVVAYLRCRTVGQAQCSHPRFATGAAHQARGTEISFTALGGCALEHAVGRPAESIALASFRLPGLRAGDHHAFDYELAHHTPPAVDLTSERAFFGSTGVMREIFLEVAFTPRAVPSAVELLEDGEGGSESRIVSPRGTTVRVARTGFGPGRVGFRWDLPLGRTP